MDEGEVVQAGQPVATLEDSELRQELAMREAELAGAQAALAELEAGSRREEIAEAEAARAKAQGVLAELEAGSRPEEISTAEAVVRREEADRDRLALEVKRYATLAREDAVTVQTKEAVEAQYAMAVARVAEARERLKLARAGPREEQKAQARAALAEAQARLALVKAGPREETKAQARARVRQAQEAVALARARLGFAQIGAPLSGLVLSKNIEPGEFVAAGTPVVTIGDLVHIWLRAYVNETDLARVKLGQRARVTVDSYPGKTYEGRLAFIASQAEFTPRNIQTEKERVKLVYRVKINVNNPAFELKPGMPADAVLEVEE